jgi:pyruvate/2-oxoglutarate/acetoin dehydrogenase E1 component
LSDRELTMAEALNEALHEEMERDPGVCVGQHIARWVGCSGDAGLLERFGYSASSTR